MSFLCVLWETCFTSSRRFSTCTQSGGEGGPCHWVRARSGGVLGLDIRQACRVLLQRGGCRETSRSAGLEGAWSQVMGPLLSAQGNDFKCLLKILPKLVIRMPGTVVNDRACLPPDLRGSSSRCHTLGMAWSNREDGLGVYQLSRAALPEGGLRSELQSFLP